MLRRALVIFLVALPSLICRDIITLFQFTLCNHNKLRNIVGSRVMFGVPFPGLNNPAVFLLLLLLVPRRIPYILLMFFINDICLLYVCVFFVLSCVLVDFVWLHLLNKDCIFWPFSTPTSCICARLFLCYLFPVAFVVLDMWWVIFYKVIDEVCPNQNNHEL